MGHLNIPNFEDLQVVHQLTEGLYTAETVEAEEMKTKKSGADMLRLRMRVVDGPAQEGGRSPVGTELSDFIVLDPSTAKDSRGRELIARRVGQVFAAHDVTVVDGDFDVHDFIGKTVIVKVKPGEDGDGMPADTVRLYKKYA